MKKDENSKKKESIYEIVNHGDDEDFEEAADDSGITELPDDSGERRKTGIKRKISRAVKKSAVKHDGGYHVKKSFSASSLIIIAAVLFVIIFAAANVNSGGVLATFNGQVSSFFSKKSAENFTYSFSAESVYGFASYDDGFALLTEDGIMYVDSSGEITAKQSLNYGDIAMDINGRKTMLFDRGGTSYSLLYNQSMYFHNNTDDSSGEIGCCISIAIQLLADIAGSGLESPSREELFQWAIKQYKANTLEGWDWHFEVIRIAIDLVQSPQEKKQLLSILEKIQSYDEDSWNYQQILNLRLQIIRKTENEEAAIRFMEANLSNPTFRKSLIEKALSEKNYPRVEELANEGIKQDEKNKPGLMDDWKNYLLTMHLQQGDKEQIMRLARYFLLQSYSRHQPRQYYYDLLKSLIPEEQWAAYVDGIIAEICRENKYGAFQPVAEIYIWEKQWDKLLAWLPQYPNFYHIEQAEPYLKEMYPQELAALYQDTILKYLERNVGREHYQKCCQYIRRMIKLGARPMATELITQLQTQYRNRRALLEELSQV